jgi:hypothetical protein
MTDQNTPAGWYQSDDGERYWDGEQWTDQVRAKTDPGGPRTVGSEDAPVGGPQPVAGSQTGSGPIYKVLTQKDRFFKGKFDPQKLEAALNSYAEQGWAVAGVATADIPGGLGGSRQELVVVMSRPR